MEPSKYSSLPKSTTDLAPKRSTLLVSPRPCSYSHPSPSLTHLLKLSKNTHGLSGQLLGSRSYHLSLLTSLTVRRRLDRPAETKEAYQLVFMYTGCIFIYITASSPNKASLGTVNGFCQVGVSITRTIGPATANSLFSLSIDKQHHYLGGNLVYAVLAFMAVLSIFVADQLPARVWTHDDPPASSRRRS